MNAPRDDSDTTRDRLLKAAATRFATNGYADTSLREIATELGITKAAVYYHFPAKSDILGALLDPYVADLDELVRALPATPAPARDITAVLEAYVDLTMGHATALVALLRDPAVEAHDAGQRVLAAKERLRNALAGGSDTDRQLRAAAALAVADLAVQRLGAADTAPDHVREHAVQVALDVLTPGPSPH